MKACGTAGKWELALKLFREMQDLGIPPTEQCFIAAIRACAKADRVRIDYSSVTTRLAWNLPALRLFRSSWSFIDVPCTRYLLRLICIWLLPHHVAVGLWTPLPPSHIPWVFVVAVLPFLYPYWRRCRKNQLMLMWYHVRPSSTVHLTPVHQPSRNGLEC